MKESKKWKLRLMNAFQLVKNGKQIGYLKFDEFAKLMDKPHDHNGEPLNKKDEVLCSCDRPDKYFLPSPKAFCKKCNMPIKRSKT